MLLLRLLGRGYLGRARILALEQADLAMKGHVAKLDSWFAADALASKGIELELKGPLHALLSGWRVEDLVVDLLLDHLLEVFLGHLPVFKRFLCNLHSV